MQQQEHSSRFKPAPGLCSEPGKLVKELRLVGVQVGCVLGKSGENIGQIRKVPCAPPAHAELQERAVLGRMAAVSRVLKLKGGQSLLGKAFAV